MKVNKNSLISLLKLCAVRGEIENKAFMLNINSNIEIHTITPLQSFSVSAVLKGDYGKIGELGIGNVRLFVDMLNLIPSDNVNITKESNKLLISSEDEKLKETYTLTGSDYIQNTFNPEKFKEISKVAEGNEFTLPKDVINYITNCVKIIGSSDLTIEFDGKNLLFSLMNTNSIIASFTLNAKIEPFNIKVKNTFLDMLNSIPEDADTSLSIKSDSPVLIRVVSKDYTVNYLLVRMKK